VLAAVLVAVGRRAVRIVLAVAVLASVGGAALAPAPERTPPAAAEPAEAPDTTAPAVLASAALGDAGTVALRVTPVEGRAYDVQIRLVDPDDGPLTPIEPPTITLRSDQIGLGEPELEEVGPSTYRTDVVIPHDGAWDAQVSVRLSEFDNPVAVVPFTLG
jgi:copper transport protein